MDSVSILWHIHEVGGTNNEKLIGVYKTDADAKAAIERLKDKPGFRDTLEGFQVNEHLVGKDGWTEGYISEREALTE